MCIRDRSTSTCPRSPPPELYPTPTYPPRRRQPHELIATPATAPAPGPRRAFSCRWSSRAVTLCGAAPSHAGHSLHVARRATPAGGQSNCAEWPTLPTPREYAESVNLADSAATWWPMAMPSCNTLYTPPLRRRKRWQSAIAGRTFSEDPGGPHRHCKVHGEYTVARPSGELVARPESP